MGVGNYELESLYSQVCMWGEAGIEDLGTLGLRHSHMPSPGSISGLLIRTSLNNDFNGTSIFSVLRALNLGVNFVFLLHKSSYQIGHWVISISPKQ